MDENVKQIAWNSGESPAQFMVDMTKFVRDTDKEDGSILMTVDKPNDKVDAYYIAFEGRWCNL